MIQYLIVCPLVFVAGLVDSIAGGGGLIALPAYLIAGVPAHVALREKCSWPHVPQRRLWWDRPLAHTWH